MWLPPYRCDLRGTGKGRLHSLGCDGGWRWHGRRMVGLVKVDRTMMTVGVRLGLVVRQNAALIVFAIASPSPISKFCA